LTQFEKSEKGFYALILTLASQTCLERAIRCFERRERKQGKRYLAKAVRFAFAATYLQMKKAPIT